MARKTYQSGSSRYIVQVDCVAHAILHHILCRQSAQNKVRERKRAQANEKKPMRVGSSSRKAAQAATQQLALFWKKELTTSSSSLKEDEADAGELDSTSTNDDDGDVAEETINIDEEPAERLPPIGIRFPIGQKIQKVFPGYNEPFKGCIVKYRWDSYYLVKYEDGDAEDMSHTDILPFVVVRSERGSSVGGDTTRERRTRSPGRHSTAHPQPVAKKMRLSSPSKRSPSPRRGKRGSPQNAKRDTMSSSPLDGSLDRRERWFLIARMTIRIPRMKQRGLIPRIMGIDTKGRRPRTVAKGYIRHHNVDHQLEPLRTTQLFS